MTRARRRSSLIYATAAALAFAASVCGPMDVRADSSFAWHMVQHLTVGARCARYAGTRAVLTSRHHAAFGPDVLGDQDVSDIGEGVIAWVFGLGTLVLFLRAIGPPN
ncbi:MAG TPA: hypothetical protein VIK27_09580 [Candidatus Aquilonibacter sp.]